MAGISDTLETEILEWLFKKEAFSSAPTELWIGLHTADPETNSAELASSGAYARAELDPDDNASTDTRWNGITTSGTTKKISNKTDITFTAASADWNSGNAIVWFGIHSASSGGTLYASGQINSGNGVVVTDGTQLVFPGASPTGNLTLTID